MKNRKTEPEISFFYRIDDTHSTIFGKFVNHSNKPNCTPKVLRNGNSIHTELRNEYGVRHDYCISLINMHPVLRTLFNYPPHCHLLFFHTCWMLHVNFSLLNCKGDIKNNILKIGFTVWNCHANAGKTGNIFNMVFFF